MTEGPWTKFANSKVEPKNPDKGPWTKFNSEKLPTLISYRAKDVPLAAIQNLPKSTVGVIGDVANALLHPIDTATQLGKVAGGELVKYSPFVLSKLAESKGVDISPSEVKNVIQNLVGKNNVNALAKSGKEFEQTLKDKYGGWENIKKTIAQDPASFLLDASSLLSMGEGGLLRAGIKTPKISSKINPLNPGGIVEKVASKTIVPAAKSTFNRMQNPKALIYQKATEGKMGDVLNSLLNAEEIVPGSNPTAAQAATSSGITKFQALGKQAREKLPTEYLKREDIQKQAQINELSSIAKNENAIKQAESTRSEKTKPLYEKVDRTVVTSDKELKKIMKRPDVKEALQEAIKLAKNRDETFNIGKDTESGILTIPEKLITSPLLNKSGKPITTIIPEKTIKIKSQNSKISGKSLDYLKGALDDLIQNPEKSGGLGTRKHATLIDTRNQLINWIEKKIPSYEEARTTFKELSGPIDQMKVTQYLKDKLVPALDEESSNLRSGVFSNALREAPRTIKASTGNPRYEKLSEVLTPGQLKKVESIRLDLARQARAEQMANRASASKNMLNDVNKVDLPPLLNRVATIANAVLRKLSNGISEKAAMEVAMEMLHPTEVANSLRKIMKHEEKGKKIGNKMKVLVKIPLNPILGSSVNSTNNRNSQE